ncbi:MAG TPA: hypothetical protein VMU15_09105 [Anaeromyxobacter sp.]|nr:hypothetical protein [Anaeromyxobacter sp.]
MRSVVLLVLVSVALAGVGAVLWHLLDEYRRPPPPPPAPITDLPSERPTAAPIDAERIQTGRLAMERMPEEVTQAIETHSTEIVHTRELLESKQARVTGTCGPGSAIRVVAEDGSVVCQRFPRGVVSVSALAGSPRNSATGTAQASVPGGVGRYQTSGEDDFLVIPVSLPDGALISSFSYTYWDDDDAVDGGAYLYRSDDTMMARLATSGAEAEVRLVTTESIENRKVDNSGFSYLIFLQMSAKAGQNLMPISASVTYRLP